MKQINFVVFLGVTFVWVVVWIAFNVYHSLTTSSVTEVLQQQVTPIDASFDKATIDMITRRHQVPLVYTFEGNGTSAKTTPSPSPTFINTINTNSQTSSVNRSLTPSPVALPTPTGGLP